MIPREILKKIRQIEIRTNRTATEDAGVLNREIRQIREYGESALVSPRSCISRGSRLPLGPCSVAKMIIQALPHEH
jgi:hypothetical protein